MSWTKETFGMYEIVAVALRVRGKSARETSQEGQCFAKQCQWCGEAV